jgi:hypothetical protein
MQEAAICKTLQVSGDQPVVRLQRACSRQLCLFFWHNQPCGTLA